MTARETIEEAVVAGGQIGFSSFTLAEIVYLSERERIRAGTLERLLNAMDSEDAVLVELPFDRHVAEGSREVD